MFGTPLPAGVPKAVIKVDAKCAIAPRSIVGVEHEPCADIHAVADWLVYQGCRNNFRNVFHFARADEPGNLRSTCGWLARNIATEIDQIVEVALFHIRQQASLCRKRLKW